MREREAGEEEEGSGVLLRSLIVKGGFFCQRLFVVTP